MTDVLPTQPPAVVPTTPTLQVSGEPLSYGEFQAQFKEPKLTKKGAPRKPHEMTEKRREAFEKCKAARAAKIAERKQAKTAPPEIEVSA